MNCFMASKALVSHTISDHWKNRNDSQTRGSFVQNVRKTVCGLCDWINQSDITFEINQGELW